MSFELKVIEQIDHFNKVNWFVVVEMESGEELFDEKLKIDAANKMLNLIKASSDKYSTKQSLVDLYGFSELADIEALQFEAQEGFHSRESLKVVEKRNDAIVARVMSENGDINSPASVKHCLTGCVMETALIQIAIHAFKLKGGLTPLK